VSPFVPRKTVFFRAAKGDTCFRADPQSLSLGPAVERQTRSRFSPHATLARVRAERATFELERDRGQWLDGDAVIQLLVRTIHECTARLNQIADMTIARLPADLPADLLTDVHRRVQAVVDEVCTELADLRVQPEITGKPEGHG
jgi:hypothetical protein